MDGKILRLKSDYQTNNSILVKCSKKIPANLLSTCFQRDVKTIKFNQMDYFCV